MSKSGTTELKEVIGSLKVGGREFPLISIKYLLQINNWPTIQAELLVKGYNNDTKAVEVDKSLLEELKTIKDNKEEIIAEFGTKDAQGSKDIVQLSCIVKSVAMSFSSSDIYLAVVLAPKYVSMDSLNLSVFKRISKIIDIDASDAYDLTDGVTLMEYVYKVYEEQLKSWNDKKEDIIEKCPEIEKITLSNIDKNNKNLYDYFSTLLKNSKEIVGDLYQISRNYDKKAYNVPQSIKNKLSEEKGSFLSNMMEIAALYCLIYVPNPMSGDDPGYYAPSSDIWSTEVQNTAMTVVGVSVNVGGLGLPELGFVYTKGSSSFDVDASYQFRFAIDACALFPDNEDAKGKSGLSVSPPTALPTYKRKQDGGSSTNDPTNQNGHSKLAGDTAEEIKQKTTSVLQEWCRQHYSLQKAMTHTATIETFFSANPNCFGKRVKVIDNQGNPILEGFVSGYEQYIKKDLGSNGTAITKLALTGVKLL